MQVFSLSLKGQIIFSMKGEPVQAVQLKGYVIPFEWNVINNGIVPTKLNIFLSFSYFGITVV
jgi:hypothetical protein